MDGLTNSTSRSAIRLNVELPIFCANRAQFKTETFLATIGVYIIIS
jgi:hypothetical protein